MDIVDKLNMAVTKHADVLALDALREIQRLRLRIAVLERQAPEGFVLVPKEPTDAMLGAGLRWFDCMGNMPRAWKDMLAAAPSPDNGEVKP